MSITPFMKESIVCSHLTHCHVHIVVVHSPSSTLISGLSLFFCLFIALLSANHSRHYIRLSMALTLRLSYSSFYAPIYLCIDTYAAVFFLPFNYRFDVELFALFDLSKFFLGLSFSCFGSFFCSFCWILF